MVVLVDVVNLGEECENDFSDNFFKSECKGPCLNNGICSVICGVNADCVGVVSMFCNFNEVVVDTLVSQDDIDDKVLVLGLCVDYLGS